MASITSNRKMTEVKMKSSLLNLSIMTDYEEILLHFVLYLSVFTCKKYTFVASYVTDEPCYTR